MVDSYNLYASQCCETKVMMNMVFGQQFERRKYKGSYMSAHVLLNLLNELGKRDKIRGLPSILSVSRNKLNKFTNTGARMLDSIYHNMTLKLF